VYLYNAKDHRPDLVAPVDVLAATGSQPFVPQAPLNLGSGGLSTVIRATVDRVALAKALHLRPEQNIMLSQTVGYPSRTPAGGKTVD
jgi:hypothetical protein